MFFPFGNGSERMLSNKSLGSNLLGLEFNIHTPSHLYRAVQEGIVYALIYGMEAFKENNFSLNIIRAGNANMFLSPLFGHLLSTISGVEIELFDTDGALGAARGALIGCKEVSATDAFKHMKKINTLSPDKNLESRYGELYQKWKAQLLTFLDN
jgi:xylulokinase